jgi:hypothetical protein
MPQTRNLINIPRPSNIAFICIQGRYKNRINKKKDATLRQLHETLRPHNFLGSSEIRLVVMIALILLHDGHITICSDARKVHPASLLKIQFDTDELKMQILVFPTV